jgi:hypothetical protein
VSFWNYSSALGQILITFSDRAGTPGSRIPASASSKQLGERQVKPGISPPVSWRLGTLESLRFWSCGPEVTIGRENGAVWALSRASRSHCCAATEAENFLRVSVDEKCAVAKHRELVTEVISSFPVCPLSEVACLGAANNAAARTGDAKGVL